MSQNKTVVPGMEGNQRRNDSADFYARDRRARSASQGTVVPGMRQHVENGQPGGTNSQDSLSSRPQTGKPLLGFLFSISKQGIGEYWPLYLGPNTIGSSPACDICLREATVSSQHAVLMVRKLKNPDKTIASLEDTHSTNGTMLNGKSLSFTQVECNNGDIITVGESYELVIFLIDIKALGLKVAENFLPIGEFDEDEGYEDPYAPRYTRPGEDELPYPPHFANQQDPYGNRGGQGYADGTVGMDGNRVNPGGTVGM